MTVVSTRSAEWMLAQVKSAAGIHFSTFKDDPKDTKAGPSDTSPDDDAGGSLWTPPPSFLEEVRRNERKAGVN